MSVKPLTLEIILIVKKVIDEGNLQPVLDVVREMPCEEDFEPRNSNVRIDFLRKWYHITSTNRSDDFVRILFGGRRTRHL